MLVSIPLASMEVAVVADCGAKVPAELIGVSEYCVLALEPTKIHQINANLITSIWKKIKGK